MGGKNSAEEKAKKVEKEKSKQVEAGLLADLQQDGLVNKLLLLGAGESGKSTLFKQMISIYGKGFSDQQRAQYIPIIHSNIIVSIRTLIQESATHGKVTPANLASAKVIEDMKTDEEKLDAALANHIDALWKDPGIQKTYSMRAKFQLNDSALYFFERMSVIVQNGYIPTQQDVLRSRIRTTGVVEHDFEIESNKFKMIDVGGQRNERKKWIHCFEGVTAVIFVAAISEYDQVCFEDESTNRMTEALNLFDDICNSRWFQKTSMILFLNKRDLFADKITKVPLTVCFPEYQGEMTYDAASDYLRSLFEHKNRNIEKTIYSHVTCATDKDNVAAVFNAVKDTIIRQSLAHAGLL